MDWLKAFKLALIEEDTKRIDTLLSKSPRFETIEEMEEAYYLLQNAKELLLRLQGETKRQMEQIEKNKKFLASTAPQLTNKFDVSY